MRAGGITGRTGGAYRVAGCNGISGRDKRLIETLIDSLNAVIMVDYDIIALFTVESGFGNSSGKSRTYG